VGERLRRINPAGMHPPVGYTHVVEVQPGRVAYISGQVSVDPKGQIVGDGDIVAQARQVMENLKSALAGLGVGFDSVIKLNYYAVDVSRLAEIRAVRDEYLKGPPASTFVGVTALARPEFLIEVEAVVALPD
jgi:enamine deaminase RidA (YjgF/YER057c/UK114 family)